jgi:hypothetical protein
MIEKEPQKEEGEEESEEVSLLRQLFSRNNISYRSDSL